MEKYKVELVTDTGVFTPEDENALFSLAEDWAEKTGWQTDYQECDNPPIMVLRFGIPGLGKCKKDVIAELSFMHPSSADEKFVVAQLVASLFVDIPEENQDEVGKACLYTNRFTLAGGFGMRNDLLYYRHNILLRPNFTYADCAQMIIDGLINMWQTIESTIDGFVATGKGEDKLDEAVKKGYFN